MKPLKIIASAAYVSQELAAEFGRLPPAFLPIGTSRLYEAQVAALQGAPIYLTLPESFSPNDFDLSRLRELGVSLIPIPDGLTLADAILFALGTIGTLDQPIVLMHGDTLIEDAHRFLDGVDRLAVQHDSDNYSWAAVTVKDSLVCDLVDIQAGDDRDEVLPVACGLFCFSESASFMRALARARGSFVTALAFYAAEVRVRADEVGSWCDFGHLQTYFRSRRMMTTARSFNTLVIDAEVATKSSVDFHKMTAEMYWLANAPPEVKPFTARLIETVGAGSYATEYIYAPTLSELFVFSSIGRPTWRRIMASCSRFLSLCNDQKYEQSGDPLLQLVGAKTADRLDAFARSTSWPIDQECKYDSKTMPSLLRIAEKMAALVAALPGRAETLMHGDFCFSNILYNSRTGRIQVLDPRGHVDGSRPTLCGDVRYDIAKLGHSILGRYDHINASRYHLDMGGGSMKITFPSDATSQWLEGCFSEMTIGELSANDDTIQAIAVSLFLSMLPLHADRPDRQKAFIANALRLYSEFERRNV